MPDQLHEHELAKTTTQPTRMGIFFQRLASLSPVKQELLRWGASGVISVITLFFLSGYHPGINLYMAMFILIAVFVRITLSLAN
jgi:hypothetical protein